MWSAGSNLRCNATLRERHCHEKVMPNYSTKTEQERDQKFDHVPVLSLSLNSEPQAASFCPWPGETRRIGGILFLFLWRSSVSAASYLLFCLARCLELKQCENESAMRISRGVANSALADCQNRLRIIISLLRKRSVLTFLGITTPPSSNSLPQAIRCSQY